MRVLIRVVAALAVLLIIGVVALALTLPRLVQSDEVRGRITDAAQAATGRDFAYGELDVGILPPRLLVTDARLAGESPEAEPMVEGADLQLRLALMPLLARSVVVDSLVLEGATLRLTRTKDGIVLPGPEEAPAEEAEPEDADEAMALAIRRVSLRDLRVVLEDRAVAPPVTWELKQIRADVRGKALDAPLDVDLGATLGSGGSLSVKGRVALEGPLDLEIGLDAVDLAPAASYLGKDRKVAGRVSGSVRARGESPENPGVVVDLRLADADVAMDEISFRGGARIAADLARVDAPSGSFELDATDAALRYGETFAKPAGTAATVKGRLAAGEDGAIVLEDTRVRIRNLDARVGVETGKRTRARLDAAPFELEGWEALLPALAEAKPRGRLAFEGLDVVPEPLAVKGRIVLDDVRVAQASGPPLTLNGALVGGGSKVTSENLVLLVAGQEAKIDLGVENLARQPRLTVRTELKQADSNQLLTAFADKPDLLTGPLDLTTDLSLVLGTGKSVVDGLSGTLGFRIQPGRLQGVSLLRSAFEQLGSFGDVLFTVGQIKFGKKLERYYGDDFEQFSGNLRIDRGVARTNDLQLVYRDYAADLRGKVGLADQTLDLTGTLTMDPEVAEALDDSGASRTSGSQKKPTKLELGRVTGTMDDPQVQLTRQGALDFATKVGPGGKQRKKLSGEIDDALGEGAGEQVLDVLDGIFGGRGRR